MAHGGVTFVGFFLYNVSIYLLGKKPLRRLEIVIKKKKINLELTKIDIVIFQYKALERKQ